MSGVVTRLTEAFCCERCRHNYGVLVQKTITGLNKALSLAHSMHDIFESYPGALQENCDSEVY